MLCLRRYVYEYTCTPEELSEVRKYFRTKVRRYLRTCEGVKNDVHVQYVYVYTCTFVLDFV